MIESLEKWFFLFWTDTMFWFSLVSQANKIARKVHGKTNNFRRKHPRKSKRANRVSCKSSLFFSIWWRKNYTNSGKSFNVDCLWGGSLRTISVSIGEISVTRNVLHCREAYGNVQKINLVRNSFLSLLYFFRLNLHNTN